MANVNKISFAVSLTPKIQMDNVDGVNLAQDVINEHVRKSLGGNGEITGNDNDITGGWVNGVNTAVTSSGGTVPSHGSATDLIFFKNSGFLFGTSTASAAADTVLVKHDGDVIGTLASGEAMILPKPSGAVLTLGSGGSAVDVEILVVGSAS
jgi:hypothetical protein